MLSNYDSWIEVFENGEIKDSELMTIKRSLDSKIQSLIDKELEIIRNDNKKSNKMGVTGRYQFIDDLRKKFVDDYPVETIKDLTIDDYAKLKENGKSFSYRIETETKPVGSINSPGSNNKFGVFRRHGEEDYRFSKGYGKNKDEAFQNVKQGIINLIEASINEDNEAILNSNISAKVLRYKIVYMYNPKTYMNIFSDNHLDFFLTCLGDSPKRYSNILEKQFALLDQKNNHPVIEEWTNFEYMKYLYFLFGSKSSKKVHGIINLFQTKEEIDLIVDVNLLKTNKKDRVYKPSTKEFKGKYEEVYNSNRKRGRKAEEYVLNLEKERIAKLGIDKEVLWVSETNDAAGYDILSFDEDGEEIYIEVKSTKGKDTVFNLSIGEKLFGEEHAENYEIHYVQFDKNGNIQKPINRVKNIFTKENIEKLHFQPTEFLVTMRFDK
ncbi:DUF3883 domain-containing protein [Enterococcus xiangfangensis]|uniref:DUF3883 domain-containing protein n=1 Tax=Enterococcus xiangfangensis TaxID=1296537 RepID=UPI003D172D65|nr:DUF3883 domain-containing protein [Enterococcus asini]